LQYQVVNEVLKFEAGFMNFLDAHIELVAHHLKAEKGTGSTSGLKYL
jgi:hypothetical protein